MDKKSAEVFQQPPTEKAVDDFLNESQSITLVTTPDPMVRFPSRIASPLRKPLAASYVGLAEEKLRLVAGAKRRVTPTFVAKIIEMIRE